MCCGGTVATIQGCCGKASSLIAFRMVAAFSEVVAMSPLQDFA